MAAFSFEEGMLTDFLLTICALRTRVNMSAIGSLMLMCILLPARFGHTGYLATHCHFANFVTSQTELLINTTWAASDSTTVAHASWVRVAWKLLQVEASLIALFIGLGLIVDNGF